MRVVIDRDTADVHLHDIRFQGLKIFDPAGEGVIDAKHEPIFTTDTLTDTTWTLVMEDSGINMENHSSRLILET